MKAQKLGEIKVTQRTALGMDDSGMTKMYVVKDVRSQNGDIEIMQHDDAKEMVEWNQSTVMGYFEVIHPSILAGSWEDNISDFTRIVISELKEQDLVLTNDYGVMFWK